MSRRSKPLPEGRYWSKLQLASHFSHSVEWLNKHYGNLIMQGMPDFDDLFNGWDSWAIIDWEDKRSMIANDPVARDAMQFSRELANGEI